MFNCNASCSDAIEQSPMDCFSCVFVSLTTTGRGLGHDSEQSLEAVHIDFNKVWARYMVRNQQDPVFSANMRQAVLTINAAHVPVG